MLNLASILVGVVALLLAIPAFIPLFGIINWIVIPVAILGLGLGLLSRGSAGRNLNLVVLIVASIRLFLGGGLL